MKYKIIITIILFIFSFLYLKNGVYLVRENDNLMKEIKEKQDLYNKKPVNAIITKHAMIPGVSGKKVNIEKSYNKMKSINSFKEGLIVYDIIKPNKSIRNIYNKVIVSGNPNINNVSIILEKDNKYCYTETLNIEKNCLINNKNTIHVEKINNNHLTKVKELVKNGTIFFLEFKEKNDELSLVIKYLKNNNYNILPIDELIKE